jgi:hypothetical protein
MSPPCGAIAPPIVHKDGKSAYEAFEDFKKRRGVEGKAAGEILDLGNNDDGRQHYNPSHYPTHRPFATLSPTTSPTSPPPLPVPIFTAVVTEHASNKNDPYLLATEPLVFPLTPRGERVMLTATCLFTLDSSAGNTLSIGKLDMEFQLSLSCTANVLAAEAMLDCYEVCVCDRKEWVTLIF